MQELRKKPGRKNDMKMKTDRKRDSFRSHWGFVIACIGSAVGMGNIWMFPARVSKYGGGSFLIPYFIFVILIGYSGVIGEMAFGRSVHSGPVGAFGAACASRGEKWRKTGELLGCIPMFGALALAIGYSVVVGWIIKYMVGTFTGATLAPENVEGFGEAFGSMASAYGNNGWQIVALIVCFVIMAFGISSGVEKAAKIMMPLFFLMFLGLAVYLVFQPGAMEGYKYIFRIEKSAILNSMTWVYALGQAFFSLSLAGNGTIIYGSYLKEDADIVDSAKKVAFFDTTAAILAALVIIPAMATAGQELTSGGPGLMFVFIPHIFKGIPGGSILAVIFFIAVFFAGITSLVNLFEAPISTLQDYFHLKRPLAVGIIAVIGGVVSIMIQGIVSGWMDFVSIYICPLGAGMAGIMFFWIFKNGAARKAIQTGRSKPVGRWLEPVTKYVFCGLTVIVFVLGIVFHGIG